jgi:hypothetical protein
VRLRKDPTLKTQAPQAIVVDFNFNLLKKCMWGTYARQLLAMLGAIELQGHKLPQNHVGDWAQFADTFSRARKHLQDGEQADRKDREGFISARNKHFDGNRRVLYESP